tara:strand:- start:313 stop:516 length:204 start_codon:yes stop_codon:yes gene_type:complete
MSKAEEVKKMEDRLDNVNLAIIELEHIIAGAHLHDADSLELQKWLKRYKSDAEQYDVHLDNMRRSRG